MMVINGLQTWSMFAPLARYWNKVQRIIWQVVPCAHPVKDNFPPLSIFLIDIRATPLELSAPLGCTEISMIEANMRKNEYKTKNHILHIILINKYAVKLFNSKYDMQGTNLNQSFILVCRYIIIHVFPYWIIDPIRWIQQQTSVLHIQLPQ